MLYSICVKHKAQGPDQAEANTWANGAKRVKTNVLYPPYYINNNQRNQNSLIAVRQLEVILIQYSFIKLW